MELFSRHSRILEADGTPMTVHTALALINEALDEFLTEEADSDLDSDSRFAVTWFEAHQYKSGPYGDAETLAKARNVSVEGVVRSGLIEAAAGKVRLVRRGELPSDWSPDLDGRPTVWEATQHLIKRLDEEGEDAAARLLSRTPPSLAQRARALAYRLFGTCDKNAWAEEGRAYNSLVLAWPQLEVLAADESAKTPAAPNLFGE